MAGWERRPTRWGKQINWRRVSKCFVKLRKSTDGSKFTNEGLSPKPNWKFKERIQIREIEAIWLDRIRVGEI